MWMSYLGQSTRYYISKNIITELKETDRAIKYISLDSLINPQTTAAIVQQSDLMLMGKSPNKHSSAEYHVESFCFLRITRKIDW
jgi:hypothetical protein